MGEVVNGPSGVDLSPFPHATVEHPNPEGANIRDLKDWFVVMFQLDRNFCLVSFNACMLETLIQSNMR